MDKTLWAIHYARENKIPCFGTCGGFQHMVIEYARNVLGFKDAQHAEYDPYASSLFISELACSLAGREMQLNFVPGSQVAAIYGELSATEHYYCNFGVNPDCIDELKQGPFYLNATMRPPQRLRIALITRAPTGTAVQSECVNAARLAAKYCEALGHEVEEAGWNFGGMELMRAFITIVFRYTSRDVGNMARLLNIDEQKLAIELNTRFAATVGSVIRDEQVQQALAVWKKVSDSLSGFYRRYDVILTPTVATSPLRSDALDSNALEKLLMRGLIATGFAKKIFSTAFLDVGIHKALYQTPFTPIANMTGQPAMSVPLHWDNDGLPHGVQFMAAEGNDRLLFQLAAQLESEHPWKHRVPAICL
jgi:Asp-tRNA(Asn)/Glu-tRNA(Gln) amidotransferase A subunit family amidase